MFKEKIKKIFLEKLVKKNQKKPTGEIALLILLMMAIGLTVGLSVVSRSVTDVSLSTRLDESSRAFSAAEAGIEEIFSQGLTAASPLLEGNIGDSRYKVETSSLGYGNSIFTFPNAIKEADAQAIWLVEHLDDDTLNLNSNYYNTNTIEICWNKVNASDPIPAIELMVLAKNQTTNAFKIVREAFDPDSSRITTQQSNLSNPDTGSCSQRSTEFPYHKLINFTNLDSDVPIDVTSGDRVIFLKLRPIYTQAKIAVVPQSTALPEQGKNITSTGQSGAGITRKWNVVQTYSAPIDLFDYAVWSGSDLTK